jgi:hypothetical protein
MPQRANIHNIVPSGLFVWSKARKELITEASDLSANGFGHLGKGFQIKSERTGQIMRFVFDREERDQGPDCEIMGWRYRCLALPGVFAVVLND